jgi:Tfp pilus assembly protein PilX
MRVYSEAGPQRGAVTMFVCLVMLVLITIMAITSYSMSSMSLRSVGNVQVREEALASANEVIERVIESDFTLDPPASAGTYPVDMNGDGNDDFSVELLEPQCVRAVNVASPLGFSVTLPGMTVSSAWNTVWEMDATATEATTGANVRVLHGVRVLLSNAEKEAVCPDP